MFIFLKQTTYLSYFILFDKFGYFFGEKLDETHALVEDKLTTFEEYLKKTPKLPADLK